ncbi:MAG: hypothetical protein ACJAYB_003070 [Psychromonas sp.]
MNSHFTKLNNLSNNNSTATGFESAVPGQKRKISTMRYLIFMVGRTDYPSILLKLIVKNGSAMH